MTLNNLFSNVATFLEPDLEFSEPLLFNDADYFSLSVLNFSESSLKIKQILESVYTDGITGLSEVKVQGQNIVGTFSDYISPTLTNKFSFEITPTSVSYQLINPSGVNFSEYLDFAKAKAVKDTSLQTKADKSGRTRSCTQGKTMPCGARCQAIGKPCKGQLLAPELKDLQKEVVSNQVSKSEPVKTTNLGSAIVLSGSRLAKLPSSESKSNNTSGSNTGANSRSSNKKAKVASDRDAGGFRNRGKVTATKALEKSLKKIGSDLDKERKKLGKLKDPEEKGKSFRRIFALTKAYTKIRDMQSTYKANTKPLDSGDLRVLGLKPGRPTERELVDSYRKASRKYHPDANPGASDAKKKELSAKFVAATEVYERLRKQYQKD